MYLQMKDFAQVFVASRSDVQNYWGEKPKVLHGLNTEIVDSVRNNRLELDNINDICSSFGTYIDACVYGTELSSFLEGTTGEDELKTQDVHQVVENDNNILFDIGYESDYVDIDRPEDSVLEDVNRSDDEEITVIPNNDPSCNLDLDVWITSKALSRYLMKKSNFMVRGRSSSYVPIRCHGIIKALSIAQFREEVSGTTHRIKLCKEHGISYAGGKKTQILNLLDHFCEYHGWGDRELDELNDIFIPHVK